MSCDVYTNILKMFHLEPSGTDMLKGELATPDSFGLITGGGRLDSAAAPSSRGRRGLWWVPELSCYLAGERILPPLTRRQ